MMKWLKRVAIFVVILLVVLAAVPFFITLDDYIPRIEHFVSEKLKTPVTIRHLGFAALPMPHLKIDGIAIGKAEDLKFGKVTVTPDLRSLTQPVKVIQSIEVNGLVLTQQGMERLAAWTARDTKRGGPVQPAAVRVDSIRLANATIKLEKLTLGPLDAHVSLNTAGDPEYAALATRDGKLKALIKPERSNYLIDFSARSWVPPVGPPLLFDELHVKGVATLTQARLGQIDARLYGGSVTGKADIGWQKGFQVKGRISVNEVQLRHLAPLFSPDARMSGRLVADPLVFSSKAPNAAHLENFLRLETPFQVHDGVLRGVDIQKAANNFSQEEPADGDTKYEQLLGHLVLDRGTYKFTGLKIVSGSFGANGYVTISPTQELSGRMNAEIKGAKLTSVPLNVSGTVQSPSLFPTAGYLAGAAVGTAILGPVLGTTVGAKIGGWVESLFGSEEEKDPAAK
jgi:hypothetical protein